MKQACVYEYREFTRAFCCVTYMEEWNMARVILDRKTVLITGAAGFIGSNLAKRLLVDFNNIKSLVSII